MSIETTEKCSVRIAKALSIRNMKQSELCEKTRIPKSAISQYLSGAFEPKQDRLHIIAKALEVDPAWLMGFDVPMERDNNTITNIIPLPAMKKIPILGTIACGEPILAAENLDGTVFAPDNVNADFALRCKGDSMINARIFDGDTVYIRQQPTVENGEIAAVLIENEATLKRVQIFDDHISLEAENPQYRPLVYWGEEMNRVRILGKAVAFTSVIR